MPYFKRLLQETSKFVPSLTPRHTSFFTVDSPRQSVPDLLLDSLLARQNPAARRAARA